MSTELAAALVGLLGVIIGVIPTYLFMRQKGAAEIDKLKAETDKTKAEAERIRAEIQANSADVVSRTTSKTDLNAKKDVGLLIRDVGTKDVYLRDRFGLPHLIKDEDTALYFIQVLGYKPSELPEVQADELRSIGAEVTALRRWRPPRTKEDDMSFEAQNAFTLLRRRIHAVGQQKVLRFSFRNNGKYELQIMSAELMLNMNAPLTVHDISPKNTPLAHGLTSCTLLFDGQNKTKEMLSQEETSLDLYITKNLTEDDISTIETVHLGYIAVKGMYREIQVGFHVQC